MSPTSALRSAQWLNEHLSDENLIILDASMQPVGKIDDRYPPRCFIPGARLFDIDNVFSDTDSLLPHTMLSAEVFSQRAQTLGIQQNSILVIYDCLGVYSAPRAWWMFTLLGHQQVYVLDGGLPAWQDLRYPTVEHPTTAISVGNWQGTLHTQWICTAQDVMGQLSQPGIKIVDARSAGRFAGIEPEPRPGLRGGHIPGAVNLPFATLFDGHGFRPVEALHDLFLQLSITPNDKLIFSCGSGVTASITLLAAWEAGWINLSLYDGSWSEWGANTEWPLETGSSTM